MALFSHLLSQFLLLTFAGNSFTRVTQVFFNHHLSFYIFFFLIWQRSSNVVHLPCLLSYWFGYGCLNLNEESSPFLAFGSALLLLFKCCLWNVLVEHQYAVGSEILRALWVKRVMRVWAGASQAGRRHRWGAAAVTDLFLPRWTGLPWHNTVPGGLQRVLLLTLLSGHSMKVSVCSA